MFDEESVKWTIQRKRPAQSGSPITYSTRTVVTLRHSDTKMEWDTKQKECNGNMNEWRCSGQIKTFEIARNCFSFYLTETDWHVLTDASLECSNAVARFACQALLKKKIVFLVGKKWPNMQLSFPWLELQSENWRHYKGNLKQHTTVLGVLSWEEKLHDFVASRGAKIPDLQQPMPWDMSNQHSFQQI